MELTLTYCHSVFNVHLILIKWWRLAGSNRWPPACKAGALPAELSPHIFKEVGKTGFEPATPWSQTKCSTKLSYFPYIKLIILNGAPDRSRTHNLLIRSQTLYPVELRALYLNWCRGPESNRYGDLSPQDFKSCASASSATPANIMERKTGFEPATPTLARWCSTTELLPHIKINRMSHRGFEPLTLWLKVRCSTNWANGSKMVPARGLEPPTYWLQVSCSTNWARPAKK